jgi:hypothetical protein
MWGVQCGEVMARQHTHASPSLPQGPPLNTTKLTAAIKTAVGYDCTALHNLIKEIPHVDQDQLGVIFKTALATAKAKASAPTWVAKANLATSAEIAALKREIKKLREDFKPAGTVEKVTAQTVDKTTLMGILRSMQGGKVQEPAGTGQEPLAAISDSITTLWPIC